MSVQQRKKERLCRYFQNLLTSSSDPVLTCGSPGIPHQLCLIMFLLLQFLLDAPFLIKVSKQFELLTIYCISLYMLFLTFPSVT